MSASEKLKALQQDAASTRVPLAAANLINALPEIVAVVEAAESFKNSSLGPGGRFATPEHLQPFWERNMLVALTALDKKLGDIK